MRLARGRASRAAGACLLSALALAVRAEAQAPSADLGLAAAGAQQGTLAIAASGSTVVLAWLVSDTGLPAVMASVSRDAGRSFSHPTKLGTGDPKSTARPVIVIVPGVGGQDAPKLVAAWPTTRQDQAAVALGESSDLGESFRTTTARPVGLPAQAIVSALALGVDGQAHALWLGSGELFYSSSNPASGASRRLDRAVSRCNVAALAIAPDRTVVLFWYRRFGQHDEEFAFTRSLDDGRSFAPTVRLSNEPWQFRSCPGSAPSLSIDRAGAIRFVFQAALPDRSSFLADTSADGRRFRARTYVLAGDFADALHPQVVPDGEGGLSLAWDGLRNGRRYVMVRHSPGAPGGAGGLDADWMRPGPLIVLDQSGAGAAPVAAPVPGAMLAAWITRNAHGPVVAIRRMTIDELCGLPQGGRTH